MEYLGRVSLVFFGIYYNCILNYFALRSTIQSSNMPPPPPKDAWADTSAENTNKLEQGIVVFKSL